MCCCCPAEETATFPFGSLWGTSENAGPNSSIYILLWLRGSKCASQTASAGVVLQQSDRLTDEVKAERLHSAPHNFFFPSSSGRDHNREIFFLWHSDPTHWIFLQPNGDCSLLSTLLRWTCTIIITSMRISAETQPLQLRGWNAEIYLVISSILGGYLSMRLKTTSLMLQFH